MDDTFKPVEMRLRLDHVKRRLQRLRTRRAFCRLEEAAREPTAKALGADRPSFPVTVDIKVGKACAVRGVEQYGRLGQINQDIRLRRAAPAGVAAFLGD